MTDRAQEYANDWMASEAPMDLRNNLVGEVRTAIEKAFRAGHSQGIADANRKVEIHEPPMAFSRGLGT